MAVANRLLGLPRVFQRDRAVEHGLLGAVVFAVGHEIAQSLKLPTAFGGQVFGCGFGVGGDFFDGLGVEEIGKRQIVAVFAVHGIGNIYWTEAVL